MKPQYRIISPSESEYRLQQKTWYGSWRQVRGVDAIYATEVGIARVGFKRILNRQSQAENPIVYLLEP